MAEAGRNEEPVHTKVRATPVTPAPAAAAAVLRIASRSMPQAWHAATRVRSMMQAGRAGIRALRHRTVPESPASEYSPCPRSSPTRGAEMAKSPDAAGMAKSSPVCRASPRLSIKPFRSSAAASRVRSGRAAMPMQAPTIPTGSSRRRSAK